MEGHLGSFICKDRVYYGQRFVPAAEVLKLVDVYGNSMTPNIHWTCLVNLLEHFTSSLCLVLSLSYVSGFSRIRLLQ